MMKMLFSKRIRLGRTFQLQSYKACIVRESGKSVALVSQLSDSLLFTLSLL